MAYALLPQISWHRSTHVAFLIRGGRIATIGWNMPRTHPLTRKHPYGLSACVHAELAAILKAKTQDLSDYTLTVLRIDRNLKLNQSKPCIGCQSVIKQLGVKRVLWTDQNGDWNEA